MGQKVIVMTYCSFAYIGINCVQEATVEREI